ncbi:hypothetical protein [Hyphococcus sp.]|uniref:hypothetical protein n=1 Tax=Hyphococcus sp. TaxID=2038636 RepID=UPI00208D89FC|nr:MAG: hypothetical protein DHS20C04_13610 [Marinicaulis sp.]
MVAIPAFAYDPADWSIELGLDAERDAPMRGKSEFELEAIPASAAPIANTALHGGVLKTLAGLNAYILIAFWFALRSDREALFMVAISAFYLLAYLGTPYLMGRVGGKGLDQSKPLSQFLAEPFETWTGTITGREAMLQVLTVPAAIAIAVTGMCLIIASHQ